MIVLVTGSRWLTYEQHYPAMNIALTELHDTHGILYVVNGGMMGADALSSYWAYEQKVNTDCEGAKWGKFGGQAGPMRSGVLIQRLEILSAHHACSTLVASFPIRDSANRGTTDCVNQAIKKGIPHLQFMMETV